MIKKTEKWLFLKMLKYNRVKLIGEKLNDRGYFSIVQL